MQNRPLVRLISDWLPGKDESSRVQATKTRRPKDALEIGKILDRHSNLSQNRNSTASQSNKNKTKLIMIKTTTTSFIAALLALLVLISFPSVRATGALDTPDAAEYSRALQAACLRRVCNKCTTCKRNKAQKEIEAEKKDCRKSCSSKKKAQKQRCRKKCNNKAKNAQKQCNNACRQCDALVPRQEPTAQVDPSDEDTEPHTTYLSSLVSPYDTDGSSSGDGEASTSSADDSSDWEDEEDEDTEPPTAYLISTAPPYDIDSSSSDDGEASTPSADDSDDLGEDDGWHEAVGGPGWAAVEDADDNMEVGL